MEHFDFDLYEELGLTPAATEQEIRAAYKKKALVHHPDRNGGVQSDEFLRLKQAYDNLIDAAKRQNYDAFHHTGEFKRDGRPLSAKEAAWLVDQQKRSWGVKEIHPFAVCILCDSCPCPADAVCDGCGMTYCQLCVRKMHCRGGGIPHYPLKSSTKFSEDLKKQGAEKEREHKLLKGNTNQWGMHPEDFRAQRAVYKHRARTDAPEMCWYWAWGQTRYTVHLAFWMPSDDCDADIEFSINDEGKQRIQVTPTGMPQMLDRVFAYEVDTSRSGEAFTLETMHVMTFVMLKAHPGQRWRQLFEGDSEGLRELPLGEPPHTVAEQQVDGFRPVNHYRVAGRKDTESEWYEVVINVPIPDECERRHLHVALEGHRLAVRVDGWMEWERRLHNRSIRWEDKHESRTHVDMQNSTWLMTRDEERDFKCVQFVLSEWQEGANKNQESEVRRQLQSDKGKILLEDADPYHLYDLVEAEMYMRAGAVFKAKSKVRKKAMDLIEQMEKMVGEEEAAGLHESPFADAWEDDDEYNMRSGGQMVVRDEPGGEVEEAAEWWAASEFEEKEEWNEQVKEQYEEIEARRAQAVLAAKAQEERAAGVAAARREEEERERNVRRKEQALKNREVALELAAKMAKEAPAEVAFDGMKHEKKLVDAMGIEQAREAAAAAARANPVVPKKLAASDGPKVGAQHHAAPTPSGAAPAKPATASLAKCGYYFEDVDSNKIKVTVPLAAAFADEPLPTEGAVTVTFTELAFRLEATAGGVLHILEPGELFGRVQAGECSFKVRPKTKKVIVELVKLVGGPKWKKLTAL